MTNTTVVVPAALGACKRVRIERFLPRIQDAVARSILVVDSGATGTSSTSTLLTVPVALTLLTGALEIGTNVECYTRASVSAVAYTADSTTDVFTIAAGTNAFGNGCPIIVSSSGTLPGGIEANRVYYVVSYTSTTVKLALSVGGTAVDVTSNGTGTITLTAQIGPQPGFGFKTSHANLDGSLIVTPIG